MLLFLGKLFIAIGLCFQAFLLFENSTVIGSFNSKLAAVLSSCDCIPADIKVHVKEHLRMAIVGLLGCSALMVVIRASFIKILVILGLVSWMYVSHAPLTQIPSFKDAKFWESLAILGGVIYLLGAESSRAVAKIKQK